MGGWFLTLIGNGAINLYKFIIRLFSKNKEFKFLEMQDTDDDLDRVGKAFFPRLIGLAVIIIFILLGWLIK
jgi:hypothetical protein